jgi:KDO2-lipid IV(A) lauroyltransferase
LPDYFLYRIGQFIASKLPLKAAYALALLISDIRYFFAATDRRNVLANLEVIMPLAKKRKRVYTAMRLFRNFSKYLVDFFRYQKIDAAFLERNVKLENTHYFKQAIDAGRGAVVLTAHLGNWELGGIVIAQLGFPILAVALVHRDNKVNDFFNNQRISKGLRVIAYDRAGRACLEALKKNEMLALVGDRDFAGNGLSVDFLGRKALLPRGPAYFSLKAKAPIIPGFLLRNPDDTFVLRMEKPIFPQSTGNKDADILDLVLKYKEILENYIIKYPDQWFIFKKFWQE